MSNFTPLVEFKTEFEGDQITMNLRRLKKKQFIRFMLVFNQARKTEEKPFMEGDYKVDLSLMEDLSNDIKDILLDTVSSFTGLKDASGNVISFSENLLEEEYFSSLVGDIVMNLYLISSPKEVETEAVKKPVQESSTQELQTTMMSSSADYPAQSG